MLTPRFTLDQDENFLTVTIYAPFTNLAETEIFFDEKDFRFFSKPYFLRLHLPAEVEESDKASGTYDADTCSFIVKAPKKNPGEHFEGLNLLSELLKPQGASNIRQTQNIEVVDSNDVDDDNDNDDADIGDDDEQWYYKQEIRNEDELTISLESKKDGYGFGFKRVDVFSKLLDECQEILDIKDPDSKTWLERRKQRLDLEDSDFNSDHYLCDLFEAEDLEHLWDSESTWSKDFDDDEIELTSCERERLIGMPRKLDIKADKTVNRSIEFGLIDILFAALYDNRTTDGEHNSESGWTIAKLSSTLRCNDKFNSMSSTVVACARRSLIYPLYRHWKLTKAVLRDVSCVLGHGNIAVIKILINVIKIFNESEGMHIFNDLYVNQYIAWIQTLKPHQLHNLSKSLEMAVRQLTKDDLHLELDELESAARMVADEDERRKHLDKVERPRDAIVPTCDSDDSVTGTEDDSDDSTSSSDSESTTDHDVSSEATSSNDEEDSGECTKMVKNFKKVEKGIADNNGENVCKSNESSNFDKIVGSVVDQNAEVEANLDCIGRQIKEINLKEEITDVEKLERENLKSSETENLTKTLQDVNIS